MLPKTSTFTIWDDNKEVERTIQTAKNMGYKYQVQIVDKERNIVAVTWIRRA